MTFQRYVGPTLVITALSGAGEEPRLPAAEPPARIRSVDADLKISKEGIGDIEKKNAALGARVGDKSLESLQEKFGTQAKAVATLLEAGKKAADLPVDAAVTGAYRESLRLTELVLTGTDVSTKAILDEKNLPPSRPKPAAKIETNPVHEVTRDELGKQLDILEAYAKSMGEFATKNKAKLGTSFDAWEKTQEGINDLVKSARATLKAAPGKNDAEVMKAYSLGVEVANAGIALSGDSFSAMIAARPKERDDRPAVVEIIDTNFLDRQNTARVGALVAQRALKALGDKAPKGLDKLIDEVATGAANAKTPTELNDVFMKHLPLFEKLMDGLASGDKTALAPFGGLLGKREAAPAINADADKAVQLYDKQVGFRLHAGRRTAEFTALVANDDNFKVLTKGALALAEELKALGPKTGKNPHAELIAKLTEFGNLKSAEDLADAGAVSEAFRDASREVKKARK